jgi:hypothetical protein
MTGLPHAVTPPDRTNGQRCSASSYTNPWDVNPSLTRRARVGTSKQATSGTYNRLKMDFDAVLDHPQVS